MTRQHPTPRPGKRPNTSNPSHQRLGYGGGLRRGALVLLLGAAACKATAVRPYITPFPDAPTDTLQVDPDDLVNELVGLVTAEGLSIRMVSAAEGDLETGWYDVESRATVGSFGANADRYVRLRFFVDPVNPLLTQLVSEAVMRRTLDPSLPERQAEVLVPPGHEGDLILSRIRDTVRTGRTGPTP